MHHPPTLENRTLGPLSMISSSMNVTSLSSTLGIFSFLEMGIFSVVVTAAIDVGVRAGFLTPDADGLRCESWEESGLGVVAEAVLLAGFDILSTPIFMPLRREFNRIWSEFDRARDEPDTRTPVNCSAFRFIDWILGES